jgi:hypothetical protein
MTDYFLIQICKNGLNYTLIPYFTIITLVATIYVWVVARNDKVLRRLALGFVTVFFGGITVITSVLDLKRFELEGNWFVEEGGNSFNPRNISPDRTILTNELPETSMFRLNFVGFVKIKHVPLPVTSFSFSSEDSTYNCAVLINGENKVVRAREIRTVRLSPDNWALGLPRSQVVNMDAWNTFQLKPNQNWNGITVSRWPGIFTKYELSF